MNARIPLMYDFIVNCVTYKQTKTGLLIFYFTSHLVNIKPSFPYYLYPGSWLFIPFDVDEDGLLKMSPVLLLHQASSYILHWFFSFLILHQVPKLLFNLIGSDSFLCKNWNFNAPVDLNFRILSKQSYYGDPSVLPYVYANRLQI